MGVFENWTFETLMISTVLVLVLLCLGKAILKIYELVNTVNLLIKMQYKYVEFLKELEKKSIDIESTTTNISKNQIKYFERNNLLFSSLTRQIRNLDEGSTNKRAREIKFERHAVEALKSNTDKTKASQAGNQSQKKTGTRLSGNEIKENGATVPLVKFLEKQMESKSLSVDENNKVVTLSSLFENKNIHRLFPQSEKKRSAVNG